MPRKGPKPSSVRNSLYSRRETSRSLLKLDHPPRPTLSGGSCTKSERRMSVQGIAKSQEQRRHMKVCGYLTTADQRRRMGKEVRQKRRIRYLDNDRITRSDTALGRISESQRDEILGNGACRVRNPLSPLPLQSRGRSARRPGAGTARCVRGGITMANGDARP